MTSTFDHTLVLEYWSAPREFVELWCENQTGDVPFALGTTTNRVISGPTIRSTATVRGPGAGDRRNRR